MNRLSLLFVAAFFLPLLDSSAGEAAEITKVSSFHLSSDTTDQTAIDPMIRFERKYILRGAVTLEDQLARYGSYYTVLWKVADRSRPMTVRFEYRQQRSAEKVTVLETEVPNSKRKNVTKFAIIGDDYNESGRVVAWRATLVMGGQVLASTESFLWD